jgi:hypothetical protein
MSNNPIVGVPPKSGRNLSRFRDRGVAEPVKPRHRPAPSPPGVDVRWQFVARGVRHFLTKPIDLPQLNDMIAALVGDTLEIQD